jgi:hypothetical protein
VVDGTRVLARLEQAEAVVAVADHAANQRRLELELEQGVQDIVMTLTVPLRDVLSTTTGPGSSSP